MKEPYLTNFCKSDAIIIFIATIIMIAAMSIANICYVSSHFEKIEKQNQEIIEHLKEIKNGNDYVSIHG